MQKEEIYDNLLTLSWIIELVQCSLGRALEVTQCKCPTSCWCWCQSAGWHGPPMETPNKLHTQVVDAMVDLLDGLDVCGHMQSWPRFDWVPAFTEPFPMFQISFWQLHWICIYLITRGALTPLAPIGCRRIASVCGTTKPFFHLLSHGSECYYVDI